MKWVVFIFVFIAIQVEAHPHHHSVAVFDYNAQAKQLELSLKMLSEDYEKIKKTTTIRDYLTRHLLIEYNSTSLIVTIEGKEQDREFIWFYISYATHMTAENNVITVENTLLKSFNKNQFNTVKITLFKQSQAHNYSQIESRYTFVFD